MKLPSIHLSVRAVVLALVAMAAIVALPAAPALAAPAISCSPDSTTIDEGGHTTVRGNLNDGGTPIASATVGVFRSTDGGSTWTSVGSATTDSAGNFHTDISPTRTSMFRCRYTYVSGGIPVTHESAAFTVTVRLTTGLTINATPTTLTAGDHTAISTTLTETDSHAAIPGAPVSLWFSTDGGHTWTLSITPTTNSAGQASVNASPTTTTVYQWRWPGDIANAPATSPNATVTVTPRAATVTCGPVDLTIDEGGSTHINGQMVDTATRAPIAGAHIFLDESTDGGVRFGSYQDVRTLSDGKFQFTVHPVRDTVYRCAHAGDEPPYPATWSTWSTVTVRRTSALSIDASPTSIASGGSSILSTQLTRVDDGGLLTGQHVTLKSTADGGATWTVIGTPTTDGSGRASITVHPSVSTSYVWVFDGDTTSTPSSSAVARVTVSAPDTTPSALGITTTPDTVVAGGSSTVTGYLHAGSTAVSGRTLTLKSSTDGGVTWTTVAHETTDASGHASHTVTPTVSTFYLWTFDGDATYDPSTSVIAGVTVSTPGTSPTTLSIASDPASITAGGSATVDGKLVTTGSAAVSGRTVRLDASTDGGTTWTTVRTATTDGSGKVEVTVSPSETTTYQWVFAGDSAYDASHSPAASVTVVPATTQTLTEHVSRHRLTLGQRLRVKGAYSEPGAGTEVALYRLRHRGPVLLGTAHLDARGHYRFRLHPNHRGTWRLRTEVVDSVTTDSPICRVRVH
ncbi:hypothetical protein [Nocardioides panacisoli]|uniref:Ig-like domain repeat protein n=1 Tax=Nocardioides panacisoli TaxID=627624 RepID=A0ABP7IWM7_9ACTN